MARRMSRRLVALSATAVTAVYLAGLATTRAADARLAGPAPAAAAPAATANPVASAPGATPAATSAAPTPGAPAAAPATASGYRDGTYTGSGTSRRGGVDVAVTVGGGRIEAVTITGGTTQYPLSRIAALPAEVVARQSPAVDRVTGATYSVQAFQQAVQQALARAQGPDPTGTGPAAAAAPPAAGGAAAPGAGPDAPGGAARPGRAGAGAGGGRPRF